MLLAMSIISVGARGKADVIKGWPSGNARSITLLPRVEIAGPSNVVADHRLAIRAGADPLPLRLDNLEHFAEDRALHHVGGQAHERLGWWQRRQRRLTGRYHTRVPGAPCLSTD